MRQATRARSLRAAYPSLTLDAARLPGLLTLAFGAVLLLLVGFVQVPAVHNGAHDTRHANGFPCH